MKNIKKLREIENILGDWNPVNVPESIKVEEYKHYAHEVFNNYKGENDIQNYLISVFTNEMGYTLSEESNMDIIEISRKISRLLL